MPTVRTKQRYRIEEVLVVRSFRSAGTRMTPAAVVRALHLVIEGRSAILIVGEISGLHPSLRYRCSPASSVEDIERVSNLIKEGKPVLCCVPDKSVFEKSLLDVMIVFDDRVVWNWN